MSDEWYYANEQEQQGPVSEERLNQLASEKLITSQTLVWNPDLTDWQPCRLVHPEGFLTSLTSETPPQLPAHIRSDSRKQAHPLAIASLVCGIVSLVPLACLSIFGVIVLPIAIAAVVCGHLARRKISRPDSQFGGGSLAMAGLVTISASHPSSWWPPCGGA